jgi:hypothetical protein
VGQTIPGIPGSTHFRNRWVKSFPEFPSSQTIPAIGKVGQMISGIFTFESSLNMKIKIVAKANPKYFR